MINKYVMIMLLLSVAMIAMENNDEAVFLAHDRFPIAGAVDSSLYSWRWPLSHVENRLAPIVPISMIMSGEITLSFIPYQDARKEIDYYAHLYPYHYGPLHDYNDTCYWVTDNRRDVAIALPFQPRHLALDEAETTLLIEGCGPSRRLNQDETISDPINNYLVAYKLATKKLYHLHDYNALHGHKMSFIGFKEHSPITAVAEFALSHQEWDLSNLDR